MWYLLCTSFPLDRRGPEGGQARFSVDFPRLLFAHCLVSSAFADLQLNFHVPLLPVPRGEGAFVALLQRRSGDVLGDGYGVDGGGGTFPESWRTRPFPLAARSFLVRARMFR